MQKNPERKIYPRIGASLPEWKLLYIRLYAPTQTVRQMEEVLQVGRQVISDYCALHNIPVKSMQYVKGYKHESLSPAFFQQCMNKVGAELRKLGKETHVYASDNRRRSVRPAPALIRPPSVYDNTTWEERINNLLNTEV